MKSNIDKTKITFFPFQFNFRSSNAFFLGEREKEKGREARELLRRANSFKKKNNEPRKARHFSGLFFLLVSKTKVYDLFLFNLLKY